MALWYALRIIHWLLGLRFDFNLSIIDLGGKSSVDLANFFAPPRPIGSFDNARKSNCHWIHRIEPRSIAMIILQILTVL